MTNSYTEYTNGLKETRWTERISNALCERFAGKIYRGWVPLEGNQRVYPDLVVSTVGPKWDVAVECKVDVGVHAVLQAFGQCMFYKDHCKQTMLLVPNSMEYRIPLKLEMMFHEADIWIVTERNIESAIAEVIEPQSVGAAA